MRTARTERNTHACQRGRGGEAETQSKRGSKEICKRKRRKVARSQRADEKDALRRSPDEALSMKRAYVAVLYLRWAALAPFWFPGV